MRVRLLSRFPSVYHCRVCGGRFATVLDVTIAVCRCCRILTEQQVADEVVRFGIPTQMEYPSLGAPYEPSQRTRGLGMAVPCPTCGADSRGEGNGRRSCINGHKTRRVQ